jgi:hypothetical protein
MGNCRHHIVSLASLRYGKQQKYEQKETPYFKANALKLLYGPLDEGCMDVCSHPYLPICISISKTGRILFWSTHSKEIWTAFNPVFQALNDNLEYVEHETDFDLNPLPTHQGDYRQGFTTDYQQLLVNFNATKTAKPQRIIYEYELVKKSLRKKGEKHDQNGNFYKPQKKHQLILRQFLHTDNPTLLRPFVYSNIRVDHFLTNIVTMKLIYALPKYVALGHTPVENSTVHFFTSKKCTLEHFIKLQQFQPQKMENDSDPNSPNSPNCPNFLSFFRARFAQYHATTDQRIDLNLKIRNYRTHYNPLSLREQFDIQRDIWYAEQIEQFHSHNPSQFDLFTGIDFNNAADFLSNSKLVFNFLNQLCLKLPVFPLTHIRFIDRNSFLVPPATILSSLQKILNTTEQFFYLTLHSPSFKSIKMRDNNNPDLSSKIIPGIHGTNSEPIFDPLLMTSLRLLHRDTARYQTSYDHIIAQNNVLSGMGAASSTEWGLNPFHRLDTQTTLGRGAGPDQVLKEPVYIFGHISVKKALGEEYNMVHGPGIWKDVGVGLKKTH